MDENPYKAPATSAQPGSSDLLPRQLAWVLTVSTSLAAAFFAFVAIGSFADATWTVWQAPWRSGEDSGPVTMVLLVSLIGVGLSLVTAWSSMRKPKSFVAVALIADMVFFGWLVWL
ncbi:MAG TPA: hypothetical protein VHC22_34035 [Pirellulales bacterium]|nr:hypothetical protein [Pirellulales bacterium]